MADNILNNTSLTRALKLAQTQFKQGQAAATKQIYTDILERFPKNIMALQGLQNLQIAAKANIPKPSVDQVNYFCRSHTTERHSRGHGSQNYTKLHIC